MIEIILKSGHAMWISPNGNMLLYASFNSSLVEEQQIVWYGSQIEVINRAYISKDHKGYSEIRTTR